MDGTCHVSVKQNTEQSFKSRLDWMRKMSSSALFLSERTLERNTQGKGGLRLRRRNLTSAPARLPVCVCVGVSARSAIVAQLTVLLDRTKVLAGTHSSWC